MPGFAETRLSVTMADVAVGQEAGFLALARELSALMARKEYGRVDIVRDESAVLRFYLVRQWASTAFAQQQEPRGGAAEKSAPNAQAGRDAARDF